MNSNGILSLRVGFTDFSPEPFPLNNGFQDDSILIAPFWDDVNINNAGDIFFRFSSDPLLLQEVGDSISNAFGITFQPTLLFIVTWDGVAQFGGPSSIVCL